MTYAVEEWMARQLLGLGAGVEVLAPESLARQVRRAAGEALEAYAAPRQLSRGARRWRGRVASGQRLEVSEWVLCNRGTG